MTAVPGVGALALPTDEELLLPWLELLEEERSFEPPEDAPDGEEGDEELVASSLNCCAKGSLLAKRLKEDSCPSWTFGGADDASEVSDEDDVDEGV
jgi:hypothetical protein